MIDYSFFYPAQKRKGCVIIESPPVMGGGESERTGVGGSRPSGEGMSGHLFPGGNLIVLPPGMVVKKGGGKCT